VEPISAITGGISIARGAIEALSAIRKISGADVISALFEWDGARVEGSDLVKIEKHPTEGRDDVWWYSVEDVPDYTFVRFPVIESSLEELSGTIAGEKNPDARYWRWIATLRRGVLVGGGDAPNIKVRFIVIGYKPKALLKYFSTP